jgi:hypothetical protein
MPGPPASPAPPPFPSSEGRPAEHSTADLPASPPAAAAPEPDPEPQPAPHPTPHPAPHPDPPPAPQLWTGAGKDTVTDLVRWAAFSCVLIPVALLWYGASLAGTAGTALGLAAVTAVCRLLLRRSERGPAGARGGRRHTGGSTPVD